MPECDDVCFGLDVPLMDGWGAEDIKFWTQLPSRYCPWKDVAAFFKDTTPDGSPDAPT